MSLLTLQAHGLTLDYSANVESLPPAGHTLLATVPAHSETARAQVEIQNRSTSVLRVVVESEDGTQTTVISLAAAAAQYGQGGGWTSTTEKGRVRVYGPAGTETVAVRTS